MLHPASQSSLPSCKFLYIDRVPVRNCSKISTHIQLFFLGHANGVTYFVYSFAISGNHTPCQIAISRTTSLARHTHTHYSSSNCLVLARSIPKEAMCSSHYRRLLVYLEYHEFSMGKFNPERDMEAICIKISWGMQIIILNPSEYSWCIVNPHASAFLGMFSQYKDLEPCRCHKISAPRASC